MGVELGIYQTREEQYEKGESRAGVEIKYDMEMARTKNVYIETAEKARPRSGSYHPAGIYANPRMEHLAIGNMDFWFVFRTEQLRGLHRSNTFRPVTKPTSEGFLVEMVPAELYSEFHVRLDEVQPRTPVPEPPAYWPPPLQHGRLVLDFTGGPMKIRLEPM